MRGEFSRYIGPGPGEQEGSRESLKGHIALAIDVLFRFFHFLRVLCMLRASKRNFSRRNKTASGPRGQTETSFKIEDLRPNKTTGKLSYDQQPEFRSLSEFYN
jgi:hypothetical protein